MSDKMYFYLPSYKEEALEKMKVPVKKKMEAAHPYNIFLTTVDESPETHEELTSMSFPELLDPYFGELESSLQITCLVDLGFLLAQYDIMGHGYFLPQKKMMVFRYTDKSVRIIVHTANLLEDQWKSYTQGLWISPKCPPLPPDTDPKVGDSTTNFKHDVLHYLSSYKVSELQPWLEILKAVDMSDVKVFFIASIPGMHTTDDWGQLKMGKILKEHIVANDGNIIAQYSVIGSLGPEPSSWFPSNMLSVFTSSKREWWRNNTPQIKFIYPTQKCVSKSYDKTGGYVGYPKETRAKQEWVLSYMCDWYSDKRYRTRALPHIKSYCRLSTDEKKIYYFVLTSANMSKAAWGFRAKSGLSLQSYEAGVILVPQILIGQDYFPLVNDEVTRGKVFLLPYDLPLVPHSDSDVPFWGD
ncbi:probable tyrosyl-DNA phosphodiesterase isoform X5 [Halyomorpha halys]|uniref:probable tyrosyl-DNA phosphodiesterase isoform X5 n=1 Tax=Halyomorpha halys TaxID=286706 RepID=UPI0006D4E877|nr:probable tyrosyl-DNA phosphodiesterase isoform X2 [Halyomorpha halys]